MYNLYKFLIYQDNTKIFDKDFMIEVTEENIVNLIELFNSSHYWFLMIRSKAFLENQDMIVWHYQLTQKIYKDCKPYMIVTHKDVDGIQNVDTFPRYFKNTRKLKIEPNLFDLENFELRNKLDKKEPYAKKSLYRNCLKLNPDLKYWHD